VAAALRRETATRNGGWGGGAAVLVVGASTLEQALDKATLKAEKQVAKQLDVSTADVDAAVKNAAGQVG
jgi:hypothetical protein